MLRESVERRLRDDHGEDGFLFPAYEDYCFANVPHTVASLLGADTGRSLPADVFDGVDTTGIDTVVVALVDGFGLDGWKRHHGDTEFLARITERGVVTPLTSIYPSETAAAVTTFHTGRLPAEHGVIGWNVYEPTVDEAFEALPFRTKAGNEPTGLTRDDVADAEPLYPELADAGIESTLVDPHAAQQSSVRERPYESLDEVGPKLRDAVESADPPSYVFTYVPHVDHAAHAEGTDSATYDETVAAVCEQLQAGLVDGLDGTAAENTLLLVTADHGHVDTDPERNVDLSAVDGVGDSLRQHADGTPIRISGSPRNVHLQLRPDRVTAVRDDLNATLDARVFTRDAALNRGLFGDAEASETFCRRCGDLVLTHRDLGTWWGDAEPGELDLVGMHGGLHPHEMLVPFAAVRLAELHDGDA
ncbi:alkaline phosphatase family protein [Halostella salina]|uniref:alkaline phosphatase family protein n=1 Tax=Halostella salina TaxID=1547897 RepID=UPI000EF84835|nr:alkaline phosphatase family protein [Halostella salina]